LCLTLQQASYDLDKWQSYALLILPFAPLFFVDSLRNASRINLKFGYNQTPLPVSLVGWS
jgi:hypothetical protein